MKITDGKAEAALREQIKGAQAAFRKACEALWLRAFSGELEYAIARERCERAVMAFEKELDPLPRAESGE